PGAPGNAILDGHLDWWTGPGVFLHLSRVHRGDTITVVRGDHTRLQFTVTGEQVLAADARVPMSMLTTTGPATLSLITCYGSWDTGKAEYQQRLIVDATAS
ncbi:MAG: class F sortase, partial [Candidatus Dormiibacterota bacterium]